MTFLKHLKFLFFGITLVSLLASCSKDGDAMLESTSDSQTINLSDSREVTPTTVANAQFSVQADCFSFLYPIDIALPDGSTQSVESDEALETLLESIGDDEDALPVFPVIVLLPDGTEQLIADEEGFMALMDSCEMSEDDSDEDGSEEDSEEDGEGSDDEGECFNLVYPIDILNTDGSTTTINSDDELDAFYEAWETTATDEDDYPLPAFPITVILPDGTEQVVNDEEALDTLYDACEGTDENDESDDDGGEEDDDTDSDEGDDGECFSFVYPIEIAFTDGNVTINSDEELYEAYDNWEMTATEDEDFPLPVFPITITLTDGTEQIINDEEALYAAYDACEGEYEEDCEGHEGEGDDNDQDTDEDNDSEEGDDDGGE